MNVISRLFDHYFKWVDRLGQVHIGFLLEALLLFGLPCLLCGIALAKGYRSIFLQALLLVVSVLLAATIPVYKMSIGGRITKGWFVAIAIVLLAFLPAILPSLVVPQLGAQKALRIMCYVVLVILFIANLF
jgi:hypothetical protein